MHDAVVGTYEEVMAQVARIASKKVLLPHDLERMQKLLVIARRCCNGPHMLGIEIDDRKVPKMAELEQTLRDLCLGEGRKAVVFSEWTDMTDRVEALCAQLGLHAFHLEGDVPVRARPVMIRRFTEQQGPAVFISTDAGGVGLNLQAADALVNLDLPWNPARLEQRIARIHQIGSKSAVQILVLVCRNSVEERILHLHEVKKNVLANIWAEGGEDTIAAPGGSGAFREMVAHLIAEGNGTGAEPEAGLADSAPAHEDRVAEATGRPAGAAAHAQGARAPTAHRIAPAHHRAGRAADAPRHLLQRDFRPQQVHRLPPPCLQHRCRSFRRILPASPPRRQYCLLYAEINNTGYSHECHRHSATEKNLPEGGQPDSQLKAIAEARKTEHTASDRAFPFPSQMQVTDQKWIKPCNCRRTAPFDHDIRAAFEPAPSGRRRLSCSCWRPWARL